VGDEDDGDASGCFVACLPYADQQVAHAGSTIAGVLSPRCLVVGGQGSVVVYPITAVLRKVRNYPWTAHEYDAVPGVPEADVQVRQALRRASCSLFFQDLRDAPEPEMEAAGGAGH
jgi:hypothetical protein